MSGDLRLSSKSLLASLTLAFPLNLLSYLLFPWQPDIVEGSQEQVPSRCDLI